jgi:excisionase family DNA binding protein
MRKTSPYSRKSLDPRQSSIETERGTHSLPVGSYLLTQEEVSRLFRVTKRTVQRWTKLNLIPTVRVGGTTRYDIEEVRRLLGNDVDVLLEGLGLDIEE